MAKQMQTCPDDVKKLFADKGVSLSKEQEHLLATNEALKAINWAQLLQTLASVVPNVISLIIALVAGNKPAPTPSPTPSPAMKCEPDGSCDHCVCAGEVFYSAMWTANTAAAHYACCYCEDDCCGG